VDEEENWTYQRIASILHAQIGEAIGEFILRGGLGAEVTSISKSHIARSIATEGKDIKPHQLRWLRGPRGLPLEHAFSKVYGGLGALFLSVEVRSD
jgi:hypothetical protein